MNRYIDPNIDITTLSGGTQLNIKANALATQGLDQLDSKPKVPLKLLSEVMLHEQGRTITRDHKVSIRNNIQLLVLEEYYHKYLDGPIKFTERSTRKFLHQSIDGKEQTFSLDQKIVYENITSWKTDS